MVDTITLTIHEEMARDLNVVVFGEDVADCGGGYRGPRGWNGNARAEAGGGDPVSGLHLARDDADSR
jgi:hypothetical protein